MFSEYMPHYVFIDIGAKGSVDLQSNPWTAEEWVTMLQLHNGLDEFLGWSLWSGFAFIW